MQSPDKTETRSLSERSEKHLAETDRHPKILVYGTITNGGISLSNDLEAFLEKHGIALPVDFSRDVEDIEATFYHQAPGEPLVSAEARGDVPSGVVVFPEMRRYEEAGGSFVSTEDRGSNDRRYPSIRDRISQLCEKHGIDCVFVDKWPPEEDQQTALNSLAKPKLDIPTLP